MTETASSYFNHNTISSDFFELMVGKELGGGIGRRVHECLLDRSLVIKFETKGRSFQNVTEWNVWQEVIGTKMARWFAPCVRISECGSILLQKRTTRPLENQYPQKIPAFLTDTKRDNYGMFEDKLVCHDYGVNLLLTKGLTNAMWNANWSD